MKTQKEKIEKLEQETIIETITNENGTAIKFANTGIMICTKTITFNSLEMKNQQGNVYCSDNISLGDFAKTFVGTPNISVQNISETAGTRAWVGVLRNISPSKVGDIVMFSPQSQTAGVVLSIIAIGSCERIL